MVRCFKCLVSCSIALSLLVVLLFLNSCNHMGIGSKTYGKIMVDRPEVFTRERLVSKRHVEKEVLEERLKAGYKHTKQGYRDIRQFAGLIGKLKADFDPLGGKLKSVENKNEISEARRAEQDAIWSQKENRLRHIKTMLELKNDISNLKNPPDTKDDEIKPSESADENDGDNGTQVSENGGSDNEPASDDTAGNGDEDPQDKSVSAGDMNNLMEELKGWLDGKLKTPSDKVASDAELTSIEMVKDEKAYRDMINAMIQETELDDTHDLSGSSLYTLKFDTTLIPGDNSQTFAKVALEIESDMFSKKNIEKNNNANKLLKNLYKRWVKRFGDQLNREMATLIYRTNLDQLTARERFALNRLVDKDNSPFTIKERIALKRLIMQEPVGAGETRANQVRAIPGDIGAAMEKKEVLNICWLIKMKYDELLKGYVDIEDPEIYKYNMSNDDGSTFTDKLCGCTVKAGSGGPEKFVEKIAEFNPLDSKPAYVYSVEPKEYAQNISDVGAREELKNFVLSLKATLPQVEGLGLDTYLEKMNQSQALLQGILRRPLAVGYTDGESKFGWVLGPKFQINNEKSGFLGRKTKVGVKYVHTAAQHSFQASVVVPAWWPVIKIIRKTNWLDNKGRDLEKDSGGGDPMNVRLPVDYSALTAWLTGDGEMGRPEIFPERGRDGKLRRHLVNAGVDTEKKTRLIIRGRDLWRNPNVFIGNQKADNVVILPNMEGLLAEFGPIEMPPRKRGDRSNPVVDLKVFTSNGLAMVKNSVEILRGDVFEHGEARAKATHIVKGVHEEFVLEVTPPEALSGYHNARLMIRPEGNLGLDWESTGGLKSHTVEKGKKVVLKFDDVKWQDGNGNNVKEANMMMESLLMVQFQPGSLYRKLGNSDSAGDFAYFKDDASSRGEWKDSVVPYFHTGDADASKLRLAAPVVVKLSPYKLLKTAYPNLTKGLKAKFKLNMTGVGTGGKEIAVEVPKAADIKEVDNTLVASVPEGVLVEKLKDVLKDGKTHAFNVNMTYAKDKKLQFKNDGELTFEKIILEIKSPEIKFEVSGDKEAVVLKNDLLLSVKTKNIILFEELKKGFKLRLKNKDKVFETKLGKKEITIKTGSDGVTTVSVPLKGTKLMGKETEFMNGLFEVLKEGTSARFYVGVELGDDKYLMSEKELALNK